MFGVSTELVRYSVGHSKEIRVLTFRALEACEQASRACSDGGRGEILSPLPPPV